MKGVLHFLPACLLTAFLIFDGNCFAADPAAPPVKKLTAWYDIPVPDPIAWKEVETFPGTKEEPRVHIAVISGGKWRSEIRTANHSNAVVYVFDGAKQSSNLPFYDIAIAQRIKGAPNVDDPRNGLRGHLQTSMNNRPEGTERVNGKICSRYIVPHNGFTSRLWLDSGTHFPLVTEWESTAPPAHFYRSVYTLLDPAGLVRRDPNVFNANGPKPVFLDLLVP